jgi:competence protein ComEA
MTKIIIGVLIVTIIALISFAVVDKVNAQIVTSNTNSVQSSESDTLSVTISGEVKKSGTYLVPLSSTLATLLEACGGVTTNADGKAYDGDFILENKQSFYIAPLYDNSNTCAVSPIEKVNINSDEKATLLTIGSINSTIATAIIDYRTNTAPFKRIEEIKNVTGIGNATFEKVKNYIQIL